MVRLLHLPVSFLCISWLVFVEDLAPMKAWEAYSVKSNQKSILEATLTERLWGMFIELQHSILKVMGISFEDLIQMMLTNDKIEEKMIGMLQQINSGSIPNVE